MTAPAAATSCGGCGAELARTFLRCPGCHALAHADSLGTIAARAEAAEAAGDTTAALSAWRDALSLLPADAPQHAQVLARVRRLSDAVSTGTATKPKQEKRGVFGTIGAVVVAVLAKAKFLLLGLSKLGTLSSMLVYFGYYWARFGWRFGGGMVLSIYVHEIGHVAMLARYGIRASAPVFIPGLGALVRLKQLPATPVEDARVGLAGPVWGLGAALASLGAWVATGAPVWAVIAVWGAGINLFNLSPVWQLDGGRGFRSMSRVQRWAMAASLGAGGLALERWWLYALAALAAWNATRPAPEKGDAVGTITYAGLVATLTAIVVGAGPAAALAGGP